MQMKKLSFIIALLLSLCFQPCAAQQYAQKIEINLQVSFDDNIDIGMPYPRMPAKGSVVTISGTRMDLDEYLSPSLFVISDYDSGNVVYSQYIDAGTTSIDHLRRKAAVIGGISTSEVAFGRIRQKN